MSQPSGSRTGPSAGPPENLSQGGPGQGADGAGNASPDPDALLCAICIDSATIPILLDCKHVFCYLCIKGVAQQALQQGQTPRCSICRKDISADFLANPRLKDAAQFSKGSPAGQYQWFYEARRGGWWQFEERLRQDLETAFEAKEKSCQLLIAGLMYQVDLQQMIQYRVGNPQCSRKIKRDLPTSQKKGIAGIRIGGGGSQASSQSASNSTSATPTPLVQHQVPQGNPSLGNHGASPVVDVADSDDGSRSDEWGEEYTSESDEVMDLEEDSEVSEESSEDGEERSPANIPSRDGARAPTSRSITSSASQVQSPLPGSASGASPSSAGRKSNNGMDHMSVTDDDEVL